MPLEQALGGHRSQPIDVMLFDGRTFSGRLADVDARGLSIESPTNGRLDFPEYNVRRVRLMMGTIDGVRDGTLIGMVIGAGR